MLTLIARKDLEIEPSSIPQDFRAWTSSLERTPGITAHTKGAKTRAQGTGTSFSWNAGVPCRALHNGAAKEGLPLFLSISWKQRPLYLQMNPLVTALLGGRLSEHVRVLAELSDGRVQLLLVHPRQLSRLCLELLVLSHVEFFRPRLLKPGVEKPLLELVLGLGLAAWLLGCLAACLSCLKQCFSAELQ